ncbi:MAG: glycosyltransferase family 2 protein [Planctomycetes bacterium]|nr:glycosyltransferase family 2 protein [Planctomycetota bacterium]MBI3848565.1 glycosyltransferase family 2 protein [Planctomycetota bacterium]
MVDSVPEISLVIPLFNEEQNVRPLADRIHSALAYTGISYEVIAVDDGSRDGTLPELEAAHAADSRFKVLKLRGNFGQTQAMMAGFERARGQVIVTMDGDLQNDPTDIPKLLATLDEGYDVVCGWRKDRKDHFLSRKLPSKIANRLIAWTTGVHVHDYGCSLKAYRASVLRHLHMYSDMHRFIPAMVTLSGARVTEVVVTHHPRTAGKSKYGISRTLKVALDLVVIKMIISFASRPAHWFGILSVPFFLMAIISFVLSFTHHQKKLENLKIVGPEGMNITFPAIGILFSIVFLHCIALALLSELVLKTGDYRPGDARRGQVEVV